ncbi:aminoacyl tRNA synthase complex-interacting multifunctional protein 1 [Ricinus communis]|uniref:Methionyl-tRNA synthetase, putative n=1 Tax=Ricinus communis TaxID=3988 RepID=B9STA0_RICCO|nr:aminoacyl tRNA synthase complex-interacting multifunctional protein 1 [Ricinus communis]EEF33175.1 methionyl-tRNA synthetase, putative [Ricinus communis]|eukprot:XP_002529219.1 aminoacyl tRNA synthase complex-interacting multifunctional protein 1 [Ricinus communis]
MATAAAATTVAVAAAVNKIIKGSRLSLGVHARIGSINTIRIRQFIIKPLATATNRFPCFCTAANVNVKAEEAAKVSSESNSDDGPSAIDAAKMLDIRVGKIIKAWRHEEADSLYVEEVDVGEAEPRIICSGLVKYIPLDYLQDKKVVVLANLKPRNMRGVKSSGMLMAASDASHENVELLEPPMDSIPGERIWFGSEDDKENQPDPASPNQVQKKKIWESVQPHLKTDDSCKAMIGEHLMRTSAGVVVCRSLKNANIS